MQQADTAADVVQHHSVAQGSADLIELRNDGADIETSKMQNMPEPVLVQDASPTIATAMDSVEEGGTAGSPPRSQQENVESRARGAASDGRTLQPLQITSTINQDASHLSERSPTRSDAGFDERPKEALDGLHEQSSTEIQYIMKQFSTEGQGPGEEEIMSPRLEIARQSLGSPVQHPPRKSSLEHLNTNISHVTEAVDRLHMDHGSTLKTNSQSEPRASRKDSLHSRSPQSPNKLGQQQPELVGSQPSLFRPPPPEPEPEPNLPFDFHRFLEQLRHKTADPVARFLRSFLQEFGRKQWMVHEQTKIISDFLSFISNKMAQCEVWREVSDPEFDNAREGMEKLVMNRLYAQTFSPAIPPPQPIPGPKLKRKGTDRPLGPGRRGQHQEDVERDEILAQKISIYGWVREQHLDIPPVSDGGRRFLVMAQQELLKIKTYRAPRDKIICVLNCCKVIFGLLKNAKTDTSADSFMPLLIYVVLQANPEHMVSNVQYILRFRNQEKLGGEAGYYLSSLLGAVQFIENLDRSSLTISDKEFEDQVEAAVSNIAEKHKADLPPTDPSTPSRFNEKPLPSRPDNPNHTALDEKAARPRRSMSSSEDSEEETMTGLLRSIQKPLSTLGRMFSDDPTPQSEAARAAAPEPRSPRTENNTEPRNRLKVEEAAARQASVEAAEVHRMQRVEHANVVETLVGMFPDLDRDIISDVVTQKDGRVGLAVDACLALSSS